MYDYSNIAPAYPSEPTPDVKDIIILRNVNIMANNDSWHSYTEKPMSTCTLVEFVFTTLGWSFCFGGTDTSEDR